MLRTYVDINMLEAHRTTVGPHMTAEMGELRRLQQPVGGAPHGKKSTAEWEEWIRCTFKRDGFSSRELLKYKPNPKYHKKLRTTGGVTAVATGTGAMVAGEDAATTGTATGTASAPGA